MIRAVGLLGFVGAFLAVILFANWWVDPFGDRYRRDAVGAALAHRPQCDVSTSVVGDTTWADYKIDLFERLRADTVVVGTSRVWRMAPRPHEQHFANLSLPGMAADSVPLLFRRLASVRPHARLTIYLNVDPFWFTNVQHSSSFAPLSLRERVKRLGSAQTLRGTLAELRTHPLDLVDPPSRRTPAVEPSRRGCVVDVAHGVAHGANAWSPVGPFAYNYELAGGPPGREDFLHGLAVARAQRWRVIGFSAPFSPGTARRVRSDPLGNALLNAFARGIPPVFAAAGFPFVNLVDRPGAASCGNADYLRHDGAHMTTACAARVRAVLDRAAAARR